MTKISVVIPLYNKEESIEETLNSIFAQTFSDFEVIIVDDGSTDKSRQIVTSFYDARLKYYYQNNSGVSTTRRDL